MPDPIPFGKNALVVFDEFLKARGCAESASRDACGYRYLTREAAGRVLGYDPRSDAVAIDYFDAQGAPLLDGSEAYLRLRLLQVDGNGKYRQKRGTHAHARLTPACRWDWVEVGRSADCGVVVVEGEFKADLGNRAKWSAAGVEPPVVGLGGVDAWSGNGSGMVLVPELGGWSWQGRPVWICFDADPGAGPPGYKPGVLGAMERLASTLTGLGAAVSVVHLGRTGVEGKGLDDYILAGGTWERLLGTGEAMGSDAADPVRELLGRYGVYDREGTVIDLGSGACLTEAKWKLLVADKRVMVPGGGGSGGAKPKAVEASVLWRGDSRRVHVAEFIQDPTREFGLVPGWRGRAGVFFNRWPGGHAAVRDEAVEAVWIEFVDRLLGRERAAWFHQWVAWCFQHPAERNTTSWFLRSAMEGIGKSMLFEAVAEAAGGVGRVLGPDVLCGEFNRVLVEGSLVVCINELSDGRVDYRRFKHYRTADTLMVNEKFMPRWEADNYVNFLVTTNEMATHKTSGDARRDIVVGPDLAGMGEIGAWKAWVSGVVGRAVRGERGRGALLWWYLWGVDVGGWDRLAEAPGSDEKDDMAGATQSVPEELAAMLMERLGEVRGGWAVGFGVVRAWCAGEGEGGTARVVMKRMRFLALGRGGLVDMVKVGGVPERVVVGGFAKGFGEGSWEAVASKVEVVRRTAAALGVRV